MSVDLTSTNVTIFVFAQPDCPACHEFAPLLASAVQARSRRGFVMHDGLSPLRAFVVGSATIQQVPVLTYDVRSVDPLLQKMMEQYEINATPTMLVLTRDGGACKVEGTITPGQMNYLLDLAEQANR